jgi:endonuclease-3
MGAARRIVAEYGGTVPDTMEELLTLPGVARKTANIVLANAYGVIDGIAVDTHVLRLSKRLGLTKHDDPVKVERDLMALFPREHWMELTYRLIEHGRAVCDAKRPVCGACTLAEICPSAFKVKGWRETVQRRAPAGRGATTSARRSPSRAGRSRTGSRSASR